MVMLFGKELKKFAKMLNLLSIKTMNIEQTILLVMIYLKKVILTRDLSETVGL